MESEKHWEQIKQNQPHFQNVLYLSIHINLRTILIRLAAVAEALLVVLIDENALVPLLFEEVVDFVVFANVQFTQDGKSTDYCGDLHDAGWGLDVVIHVPSRKGYAILYDG